MKYTIVRTRSVDFEEVVNAKINEGYKPIGGVSIGNDGKLLQAMIKEKQYVVYENEYGAVSKIEEVEDEN